MSSVNPILQQYRDDGFYVARGLLALDDVLRVRDTIIKSFADQLARSCPPETYSDALLFELMQALFQSDVSRYKKLVAALWRKLDVYQLMHHPKIVAFLREQFGWNDIFVPGGQIVLIMSHELRIQDGYFGVSAHQDFPSVQGSLDGVVVWLPLMKIDAGNFPLEVIPKSHLQGLLPTVADAQAMWQLESGSYRDEDFVKLCAEPGDVAFMSLFTVHRSAIDGDAQRLRLALSTRFDHGDEPSFVERIYPSAYVRSVNRDLMHADFPSHEQVLAVFSDQESENK